MRSSKKKFFFPEEIKEQLLDKKKKIFYFRKTNFLITKRFLENGIRVYLYNGKQWYRIPSINKDMLGKYIGEFLIKKKHNTKHTKITNKMKFKKSV